MGTLGTPLLTPLGCGLLILLIDQWSKRAVEHRVSDRVLLLGPLLRIRFLSCRRRHYARPGARVVLALTWAVALAAAVFLHRETPWFQSLPAVAGLGAAFGGAFGNLVDILWRRRVTDFIDLGWWPVFNLADAAIVVGLAMAFLG